MVGVERSTSETARRTSKGRKIGAWCICNARKASPQGRAHIWVVFSCKGAERDEWRGPKEEPLSWRLIKNAKFQRSSSRHRVFSREPIRHSVVDCPLCSHSFAANHITAFYCAYTVRNCSKIIKKPEVEIWRKHAQSIF